MIGLLHPCRCGHDKQPWILLYRGSRDGFRAQDFHTRCDNFGPTVVIVQVHIIQNVQIICLIAVIIWSHIWRLL